MSETLHADTLLYNGRIYTLDHKSTVVESLALHDGKIVGLGDFDEIRTLVGPTTELVDLEGAVAMPGLMDAHNHHYYAGLEDLFQLKIASSASIEEIIEAVRVYASTLRDGEWIVGGAWGSRLLDKLASGEMLPLLDEAAGGHPVLLSDDSHHNKWANTAAMRIAGIFDVAVDPSGGRIVRDNAGMPTGLLLESAGAIVEQARQSSSVIDEEVFAQCSARGIELLHRYGVTAFQDAAASREIMAGLSKLDREGKLAAWVVSSVLINDFIFGNEVVGEELLLEAERYRTPHHRPVFAKIFLDGIPPSRTAAFIEPYLPDDEHGAHFTGATTMPAAELAGWLQRTTALGIGVKVHCTGDATVRMVLDTVEQLQGSGVTGLNVQIAHGQYVHPDDIPRFAQLGVIAEISPALWYPGVILQALQSVLPEPRASRIQPNRDLLDAGALIAGGSDWPVAESPNPWLAIAGLVTRQDPTGRFSGSLWPEQAITVEEAIRIYTTAAAKAMGIDDVTGHLVPGLAADFVILDQDPFRVDTSELPSVTVLETWFAGKRVFSHSPIEADARVS